MRIFAALFAVTYPLEIIPGKGIPECRAKSSLTMGSLCQAAKWGCQTQQDVGTISCGTSFSWCCDKMKCSHAKVVELASAIFEEYDRRAKRKTNPNSCNFSGKSERVFTDPCNTKTCGTNEQCVNKSGVCSCQAGFVKKSNVCTLIDPCDNVNCGDHSTCSGGVCDCVAGFVKKDNVCELVPIPCPSNSAIGGCWSYDKSTNTCSLVENADCAKIECEATYMRMSIKAGVLEAEQETKNGFSGPTAHFYTKQCDLDDTGCLVHSISSNGDELIFKHTIGGTNELITLGNELKVDITPGPASFEFICTYSTSVTVDSAEFNVQDVAISGETSATGKLDSGFTLTVGDGTPIILGQTVTVKATWSVKLADIEPHFRECTVHHGSATVMVINQGCMSSTIGLTNLVENSDNVFYSMDTFTVDGQTSTKTQSMKCGIMLCKTTDDKCYKASPCPDVAHFGYN